jgi:hypothetical protein
MTVRVEVVQLPVERAKEEEVEVLRVGIKGPDFNGDAAVVALDKNGREIGYLLWISGEGLQISQAVPVDIPIARDGGGARVKILNT